MLYPGIKTPQELIIFCYAQERVLLPLPKSYEDAQDVAQNEFSLAGDLIFETDNLPGSDGLYVRIHRTVWESVSSILRSVTVKLPHDSPPLPPARPRPSETISSGSRRLSSQKRISMVGSPPVRLPNPSVASHQPLERHSVGARKALLPLSSSSPRLSFISTYKDVLPSASSPNNSPPHPPKAATPEPSKIEELDGDEEEGELRILSPKKKRSARPRVMSDYGVDNTEARDEDGEDDAAEDALKTEEAEDEFDALDDAELVSSAALNLRQRSRASTPTPSALSRSGSGSLVELDGSSSSGPGVRRNESSSVRQLDVPSDDSPKIKAEKVKVKAETSQPQSQPQAPSDDSFLIMIEYSEDPESRSLFKTRGRHSVSKVLLQACRTFGIDKYYRSARLVLVVEEEEGDGEIVYQRRYVCNRDETMAQAGAEPNAKFVVEVVYEDDE